MQGETFDNGEGQERRLPPEGVPGEPEELAPGTGGQLEDGEAAPTEAGGYSTSREPADTQPPMAPETASSYAPYVGEPQPPQYQPPDAPPYAAPPYASPPYATPDHAAYVPTQPQRMPTRPAPIPSRPPIPPRSSERHGIPWYAWVLGAVAGAMVLVLVGCCALGGMAFGLLGQLRTGSEQTETTTRTFAVTGTPTLDLHDPAGNISITPGDNDKVVVQATKRVREGIGGNSSTDLAAINVQMMQSGSTIAILVQFPSARGLTDRSVDLDITTPATTNLTSSANAGNVTLGAISGQMMITESAGNVTATGAAFQGSSRIDDSAGNVTLDGAVAGGATLAISVNAGNVSLRLPASTPAHLSARANVGTVTVTGWPITPTRSGPGARASGDLAPKPTATITVAVSSGTITVEAK